MIIPIKPWLDLANSKGAAALAGRRSDAWNGLAMSSNVDFEESDLPFRTGPGGLLCANFNHRMEFYHDPILAPEILEAMQPVAGKQILDGT